MRYLTVEELVLVAKAAVGADVGIRDIGLLESAVARPRTTVVGEDAYADVFEKAAALLHSLMQSHPLVDGNKRLGFVATATFLDLNGYTTDARDDDRWFDLIMSVATGHLGEVGPIAKSIAQLARSLPYG